MKMKNTVMALGVAAVAMTALVSGAEAGGWKGKHRGHFHHFPIYKGYHYGYYDSHKSCWWYKKKYFRTGNYFWLKKYDACRYGW